MQVTHGVWASSASWELQLALQRARIGYVVADCQHGSWSQRDLEQLFFGLGLRPARELRPLIRTGIAPTLAEIGRCLDAGAWGLIVPFVEHAGQLREVRTAMHYPPRGVRSAARNIGIDNTGSRSLEDYIEWSRQHLSLTALVETGAALNRLEEIAEASDSMLFGLRDLCLSLGVDIEGAIEIVGERLAELDDAKPFGYLGIEPLRQQALRARIINLGNVRDFIGEAITNKLRELGVAQLN